MADRGVYRNEGAPFPLPGGTRVRRGEEFEADIGAEFVRRRANKVALVRSLAAPGEPDPPAEEPEGMNVEDYAQGNGYYLIGGETIHGRSKAIEALRALDAEE